MTYGESGRGGFVGAAGLVLRMGVGLGGFIMLEY